MPNRVNRTSSQGEPVHAEGESRRLRPTLPHYWADYAEDLAASLNCSISSLAEGFLRAHQAHPIESLAACVAEVEARGAAEKKARGQANVGKARERRWPDRKSDPNRSESK